MQFGLGITTIYVPPFSKQHFDDDESICLNTRREKERLRKDSKASGIP